MCGEHTVVWRCRLREEGDHPRMRGEHSLDGDRPDIPTGSSPHARGTHPLAACRIPCNGIIPACAGNTVLTDEEYTLIRDHPRMRGEHQAPTGYAVTRRGSSPHARGTHLSQRAGYLRYGIIPACAGNTCTTKVQLSHIRDHPRMRGEHALRPAAPPLKPGSSPHARGTRDLACFQSLAEGIIPACAGNTGCCAVARRLLGDHPRMRGEHWDEYSSIARGLGSSPHARGTQFRALGCGAG